jgi:thiol-disulfide isomerase/thioredoxin
MSGKRKALWALGALVVAAGLGLAAWNALVEGPRKLQRAAEQDFGIDRSDAPAPDFRHQTADGGTFQLAQHKGEVVFVNFWATWCPPCRAELPSMLRLGQELQARHPGKFRMVAVSVDDGWAEVGQFFGGPPPPGLTVTLDTDQLTTRAYYCVARGGCPDSFKFPETYLVDRKGQLVAYVVGPRDWSSPVVKRFLEQLIER